MHNETLIGSDIYQAVNRRFRKKLVFHVGASAGFFSQYNNMIMAMLFCLVHEIRFVLYSADAKFGYDKGWEDWFLPFAPESRLRFHSLFNYRTKLEKQNESWRQMGLWPRLVRRVSRTDYMTYELFDEIRAEAKSGRWYSVPELGIEGQVREAGSRLVGLTWRFNERTTASIREIVESLNLPREYVGIHIRGGDKALEGPLVGAEAYLRKAEEVTPLRTAFIATDDYTNVETLRRNAPDWEFITLCRKDERGYNHDAFKRDVGKADRRQLILILLATMEVLRQARPFVGAFNSNFGTFLGMAMDPHHCIGVDAANWYVW